MRVISLLCSIILTLPLVNCGVGNGATAADPAKNGAQDRGSGTAASTISVMAKTVSEGSLVVVSEASGTVNPVTQSNVTAQTTGMVLKRLHQAGDWVKAGEAVVKLDDTQLTLQMNDKKAALDNAEVTLATNEDTVRQQNPQLKLQVQSAEAAVASAQKSYDSTAALFKVGGATSSQVDSAQSALQTAQANLHSAQLGLDQNEKADKESLALLRIAVDQAKFAYQEAALNLQYTSIKAPFAGQIVQINVSPGESVTTTTTVFVVSSEEKEIDFSISPADAPHLKMGSKLSFSYQGKQYPIVISQHPAAAINGMVPMVAAVPASFPVAYGAVGAVDYEIDLARGIIISIASIQSQEDRNCVFVLENDKAVQRTITIIAESGVQAAVSGIADGAQIIVSPPPGLLSGSAIKVVPSRESASSSEAGNP